jgi:hypothetical protein
LAENVDRIFPKLHPANAECAIAGLAYAPSSRRMYRLLRNEGVIDWALRVNLKASHSREKLIQRLTLAYLWGEEPLDSPRWSHLFESQQEQDLIQATRYLWSIKGGELSSAQRQQIIEFFERCVSWGQSLPRLPEKLCAALATLAGYLSTADGKERVLLEAVAPFVHVEHGVHEFIEELQRLVEVSPQGVSAVLGRLLSAQVPSYDYEDRLKALIARLAESGLKPDAISHAERARALPGMQKLFDRLTRSPLLLNTETASPNS